MTCESLLLGAAAGFCWVVVVLLLPPLLPLPVGYKAAVRHARWLVWPLPWSLQSLRNRPSHLAAPPTHHPRRPARSMNAFGQNTSNPDYLESEVARYALYFVYLGLAAFLAAYCQVAFWTLTGERSARAGLGLVPAKLLPASVGARFAELLSVLHALGSVV